MLRHQVEAASRIPHLLLMVVVVEIATVAFRMVVHEQAASLVEAEVNSVEAIPAADIAAERQVVATLVAAADIQVEDIAEEDKTKRKTFGLPFSFSLNSDCLNDYL